MTMRLFGTVLSTSAAVQASDGTNPVQADGNDWYMQMSCNPWYYADDWDPGFMTPTYIPNPIDLLIKINQPCDSYRSDGLMS